MNAPRRGDDIDARLPPGVAAVVARGETCWLCDHPRALPPSGSPRADWVVLPLAFAWMYPDSMVVADALEFAARGLILEGELVGAAEGDGGGHATAALRRLAVVLGSLQLEVEIATQLPAPRVVIVARCR